MVVGSLELKEEVVAIVLPSNCLIESQGSKEVEGFYQLSFIFFANLSAVQIDFLFLLRFRWMANLPCKTASNGARFSGLFAVLLFKYSIRWQTLTAFHYSFDTVDHFNHLSSLFWLYIAYVIVLISPLWNP